MMIIQYLVQRNNLVKLYCVTFLGEIYHTFFNGPTNQVSHREGGQFIHQVLAHNLSIGPSNVFLALLLEGPTNSIICIDKEYLHKKSSA